MTGFNSKRAAAQAKLEALRESPSRSVSDEIEISRLETLLIAGEGMKTVRVETLIVQDLEVPEDWDRIDVFDFLAEYQSFRTAFQGVSNEEQTARIVDLSVVDERVTEMGEEAYDE
jgi:hypothetical protein